MLTNWHSWEIVVGGISSILLVCSIAVLRGGIQAASAPGAPEYESREEIVAAIASGKLKTITLPKETTDGVKLLKDIEFGNTGEHPLKLVQHFISPSTNNHHWQDKTHIVGLSEAFAGP